MKYVGLYDNNKDIVTKDKLEAVASRVSTNEDNIAIAESDIDGLQTSVGTLQTNVNNVQTALTSKQDTVVGGASTITEDNLTASRALVSNSSGKVAVSTVTSTELGYLDGVTSNVQAQLNGKQPTITVNGIIKGDGAGNLSVAELNPSSVGLGNVDNVKQYSASNPPPYPVTSVNGKTGAVSVNVPSASSTTPKAPGTASAGTSAAYARGDHVHPKQTVTKSDVGLGNVDNVSINTRMNRTTNVNASDSNYTTYMARGIALSPTEQTPSVNGAICLVYG